MSNSSDNQSCFTAYDTNGFLAVVGIRAGLSVISFICCLGMILLILLFKKYLFFTQRLILYLAIATMSYSVVSAINVEGFKAYRSDSVRGYCIFAGFLEQVGSWWVLLAVTCIMVDLFLKVTFKKATERLEILYVPIIFVSPLIIAWIPFINLAYGPSGAWCWIRGNEYADCSSFAFGTWLRFLLYYVPLYVLMFILLILLIIILVQLKRQSRSWTGNFEPSVLAMKEKMSKEIFPLIAYPIIFLVLNLPPFALRITNNVKPDEPVLALWIISATVFSLQGVVITLAFALDPETRRHLTLPQIAAAIKRLFTGEGAVEEYPMDESMTAEPEIMNSSSFD